MIAYTWEAACARMRYSFIILRYRRPRNQRYARKMVSIASFTLFSVLRCNIYCSKDYNSIFNKIIVDNTTC